MLRNRAFVGPGTLYAANCLIEWFGSVALMVVAFGATGSALAATGLLLGKQILPGLIVPKFGEMLDRRNIRSVLPATMVGEALALGAIVALGYGAAFYVLAAVAGTLGALTRVSLRAHLGRVLIGDALRSGNAALNVAVALTGMAGPALAAAAVAGLGTDVALMVGGAALSLMGFVSLLLLRPVDGEPAREGSASDGAMNQGGQRSPIPMTWLLGFAAVAMAFCTMDEPALLPFSEDALHAGVAGFGAIYAAWGVGLALGSLAFTRMLKWSMVKVVAVATALAGVGYLGMGLSPTLEVACSVAVVGGFGNGIGWVAFVTLVQESASSANQAKAAARLESISMVAPGIGVVLGGLVAELAAPRLALTLPGIGVLLLVGVACFATRVQFVRPQRAASHLLAPTTGGSA